MGVLFIEKGERNIRRPVGQTGVESSPTPTLSCVLGAPQCCYLQVGPETGSNQWNGTQGEIVTLKGG